MYNPKLCEKGAFHSIIILFTPSGLGTLTICNKALKFLDKKFKILLRFRFSGTFPGYSGPCIRDYRGTAGRNIINKKYRYCIMSIDKDRFSWLIRNNKQFDIQMCAQICVNRNLATTSIFVKSCRLHPIFRQRRKKLDLFTKLKKKYWILFFRLRNFITYVVN